MHWRHYARRALVATCQAAVAAFRCANPDVKIRCARLRFNLGPLYSIYRRVGAAGPCQCVQLRLAMCWRARYAQTYGLLEYYGATDPCTSFCCYVGGHPWPEAS